MVICFMVAAHGADLASAQALKSGSAVFHYGEPQVLAGAIYARESNRLLFNFKRFVERTGSTLNVRCEFHYPDGKLAALENVTYDGDTLVSYTLNDVQTGARGTAKIRHSATGSLTDNIEFEYSTGPGTDPRVHTEPSQANTLVPDMMGAWLASQWEALNRGEKLKCRLIVVPLTGTVGFTLVKDSEASQGDQQVLIIRMEPTSPFISVLLRPLFFTMEKSPRHRILQYDGRITPKVRVGDRWNDVDAITVFDWQTARW